MMTPDGEARCGGETCRRVMSRPDFPTPPEIDLRVLLQEAGPLVAALSEDGKLRLLRGKENSFAEIPADYFGRGPGFGSALLGWIHGRRPHGLAVPVWHAGGEHHRVPGDRVR